MPWPGHPLTDTFRGRRLAWGAAFVLSLLLAAVVGNLFKPAPSTAAQVVARSTPASLRGQYAALVTDIDICESAERRKRLVRTCIDQGALRRQWGALLTPAKS